MSARKWQYRIAIAEALDWPLEGVSLNQAITDEAETDFGLSEIECTCVIEVVGDEFVATLEEFAEIGS